MQAGVAVDQVPHKLRKGCIQVAASSTADGCVRAGRLKHS